MTLPPDPDQPYQEAAIAFQPWLRAAGAADPAQAAWHALLARRAGARLGASAFVARGAHVFTSRLALGAGSWIAAGAILRGDVRIGENSSINSFAHVAGAVAIGSRVRIAGGAAIYGFRQNAPQGAPPAGVTIGDDSTIGPNAVIGPGVRIGAHCTIAAGAVVETDMQDHATATGNPAVINAASPSPASPPDMPPTGMTPAGMPPTGMPRVRALLHDGDPYADPPFRYPPDMQGWDSEHAIFGETIAELRPRLIVELGSWKGASAIHMARLARELNLATEIVCIDTWLGNWQHWSRATGVGSRADMRIVNGMPRLYYQFLSNVIAAGMQDLITPLPLTAVAGAKLFEHLKLAPDMVYLDGDHEYESAVADLRLWMKRLAPAGVLVGDDYNWPGVRRAVNELAAEGGLIFRLSGNKFTLRRG